MLFYKFLDDIPQIPNHLIDKDFFEPTSKITRVNGIYNQHRITNIELHNWLQNNIPFENFTYSVQRITNEMPIHTDVKRTKAINYIIQTGGENITTNFHYSDNSIITSIIVPKNKWCYMDVGTPHSVTGHFIEPRIGITITLDKQLVSNSGIEPLTSTVSG